MDIKQQFEHIMATTSDIALATAYDNQPNVRVVNFIWDKDNKVVYFCTIKRSPKVAEIEGNPLASLMTIPVENADHRIEFVKVDKARVTKSNRPLSELKEQFFQKYPAFKEWFKADGEEWIMLYEVSFKTAALSLGYGNWHTITL